MARRIDPWDHMRKLTIVLTMLVVGDSLDGGRGTDACANGETNSRCEP
jgi:hypothetical protein